MILSTIPIMKLSFKANKAKKREGEGERERERERGREREMLFPACMVVLL